MSPWRAVWADYAEAARRFSRPARHYLLGELLAWTALGMFQVLFNLFLVEQHFQPGFIGRAVSFHGLGMALAALPAGILAERWGRRRTLILGALVDGIGLALRVMVPLPGLILAAGLLSGSGQALLAIAAAPFLTEHSTPRERTHLFSAFFANSLLAGVVGSLLGGWLPGVVRLLPITPRPDAALAYRITLLFGAALALTAATPLARLGDLKEERIESARAGVTAEDRRKLIPITLNALLIGMGAGLVIPFMNLYFATRFHCSSGQIGVLFSIASVCTAVAALLGPAIARKFGKLRTATASELLSLPFLVTLGAERRLGIAAGAFWIRASLMQAAAPLLQAFVMESLPSALRPRASSLINMVWNVGWALSATLAGVVIEHFGYAQPFYFTASLYLLAAATMYFSFRGTPEIGPGDPEAPLQPEPAAE
ncbi:MAG: MFS transporter [Candidatus Eiseniibacteriota bacterium]